MAVDVIIPQMGRRVFLKAHDQVASRSRAKPHRARYPFEISTDKVDSEIPAPSAGVLKEIQVPKGSLCRQTVSP